MHRNVLHGVMKNVNVNTLENVKGIESKIKSFSSFYHVALFNLIKILGGPIFKCGDNTHTPHVRVALPIKHLKAVTKNRQKE
jgi:hypothetical protein